MQRFRSDSGSEFDTTACQEWMQTEGIQWEPTTPYNPHQNGVAKWHIICALLYDAGLPNNQWGEANVISTAVYLKNRRHDRRRCPTSLSTNFCHHLKY